MCGGATATDLDARAGNSRDLLVIAPLVLAVSFVVLLLLLQVPSAQAASQAVADALEGVGAAS